MTDKPKYTTVEGHELTPGKWHESRDGTKRYFVEVLPNRLSNGDYPVFVCTQERI